MVLPKAPKAPPLLPSTPRVRLTATIPVTPCQQLLAGGAGAFPPLSELPALSSSSLSAMKRSKLWFKRAWPCARLSSGQLFRRHLMLNMELLTEMSCSLQGSWQTAGESQEEQKRFIGKKVLYYRQRGKNRNAVVKRGKKTTRKMKETLVIGPVSHLAE